MESTADETKVVRMQINSFLQPYTSNVVVYSIVNDTWSTQSTQTGWISGSPKGIPVQKA